MSPGNKFFKDFNTFCLLGEVLAISDLDRLARSSRALHDLLISNRDESKGIWAQVAARMTSFPERLFFRDRILAWLNQSPMRLVRATAKPPPQCEKLRLAVNRDFFKELRCLMCPWSSTSQYVELQRHMREPVAMAVDDASNRMILHTRAGQQMSANVNIMLPAAARMEEGMTASWMVFNVDDVEQTVDLTRHKDMCHEDDVRRLMGDHNPIKDCSTLRNCTYRRFVVSGAVVAITEVFNHERGVAEEASNGLYFVSVHDGRILLRRTIPRCMITNPFLLVSRPSELWYTYGDSIVYMYPRTMSSPLFESHLSILRERMHPALWMASNGDAVGAARYLDQICWRGVEMLPNIDVRINMQALHDRGTVLHYAAKAGQAEACARLLDMKANPSLCNYHGDNALCLALSRLHVDVVEVMLSRQWKNDLQLEMFHRAFRALSNPKEKPTPFDADEILVQCRETVPRATRALLFNLGEFFNVDLPSFKSVLNEALRSPTILASADSVRLILDSGGESFVQFLKKNAWIKSIFEVSVLRLGFSFSVWCVTGVGGRPITRLRRTGTARSRRFGCSLRTLDLTPTVGKASISSSP